jgi:hypothetical protein
VRYSEQPGLWESIEDLSAEVWPEYNLHGQTLNHYWDQLYDVFPEWQFVLCDPDDDTVLAEGHTIPVAWDGTDSGLGPGIDAIVVGAFELRAAGGRPTAVCALAAEIPPRHQGRRLSSVLLRAMSGLGREAGLEHLIAPVRPSHKDRYPTIPIERYARWTRPDGSPFDPWVRVHTQLGARIGPTIPHSLVNAALSRVPPRLGSRVGGAPSVRSSEARTNRTQGSSGSMRVASITGPGSTLTRPKPCWSRWSRTARARPGP